MRLPHARPATQSVVDDRIVVRNDAGRGPVTLPRVTQMQVATRPSADAYLTAPRARPVAAIRRAYPWTIRQSFVALALILGLIDTVASRNTMNPDGISYLDMGDAFWRGDWHAAVNGLWSPLYGTLIGAALRVTGSGPRSEFPTVHAVNFLIYTGALLCFDFLVRMLIVRRDDEARWEADRSPEPLPAWALCAVAYPLFTWATLSGTGLAVVAPDVLGAAFMYLAAGLLVRRRRSDAGTRRLPALGIVLAIGYLARGLLFPLAVALLGAAWAVSGAHGARRSASLGIVLFVAISAPLVVALSAQEGHVTVGDSAVLNYAFHVNGVPYVHWRGGPPGCGTPTHPVREPVQDPVVYEFSTPVRATYPLWYAPAYWYDGIVPCIAPRQLVANVTTNLKQLSQFILVNNSATTLLILSLWGWAIASRSGAASVRGLIGAWGALLLAGLGLAGLTAVYVEPRFIAAFGVLLWTGLLSAVRLPTTEQTRRGVRATVAAFVTVMLIMFGGLLLDGVKSVADDPATEVSWRVAVGLQAMGVRAGDRVAVIGTAFPEYWARLARVMIVAEVPDESVEAFWAAPVGGRERALNALTSTGARAIVTEDVPPGRVPAGWRRVGGTPYYVRFTGR